MKICIAEDKIMMREEMRDALLDAGYSEVFNFENTEKAVNSLNNNIYDILVTDIDLGDDNRGGFRLFNEVIKKNPDAGVLFVSDLDEAPDLQEVVLSMNYDFLMKPFKPGTLIRIVASMERAQQEKIKYNLSSDDIGPIVYKSDEMEYYWKKRRVRLAVTHKKLLGSLLLQAGKPIPRKDFMFALMSGKNAANLSRHMSEMRKRFKDVDYDFSCIKAVSGGWTWDVGKED